MVLYRPKMYLHSSNWRVSVNNWWFLFVKRWISSKIWRSCRTFWVYILTSKTNNAISIWRLRDVRIKWATRTSLGHTLCPHTDAGRTLHGTVELQKAVEMGYKITKIQEVWHFKEDDRRVGLFADFVNTWLKIKQECAGWPNDCVTAEQKQAYIRAYEQTEGIKLENVQKTQHGKRWPNWCLTGEFLFTCSQSLPIRN